MAKEINTHKDYKLPFRTERVKVCYSYIDEFGNIKFYSSTETPKIPLLIWQK